MKKNSTILIGLLIVVLSFTLISCNSNTPNEPQVADQNNHKEEQNSNQEPSQITTDEGGSEDTTDSSTNKPADNDTEKEQPANEALTKYFINKNYMLKPVDPESPSKVAFLTFDDAPQGNVTIDILDTLDKYNVKAAFFINGHYAVKDESLLKEIYNRGHILANHTWWHYNLKDIDYETTKEEIVKVNDLIEKATGERPKYFRPPFGVMSDDARKILIEENMQSMNWSLGSLDWEYPNPEQADKVIEQVITNIHSGANILMHDKEVTSLALDQILNTLTKEGYSFVLPTEVIITQE